MIEALPSRTAMRQRLADSRRRSTTTPGRLRVLSVSIAIAAVCLMAIGCGTLVAALETAADIQQRTLPAIVGMERVHALLSDADRSAAGAYLVGANDIANSQLAFDAESAATNLDVLGRLNPDETQLRYEADIAAASHELQRATTLNLGGDEASQRLQSIAVSVANYTRLVQTAMLQGGMDFAGGTVYLQAATNLMHGDGGILAQVDAAQSIYEASLDRDNLALKVSAGILILYGVVAAILLGLLIRTQRFVRTRFRRRRNPRLLAATVVLLLVAGASGFGTLQASQALRSAQNDSYARLATLWNARSIAYDAYGQEAMRFILHSPPGGFQRAFQADIARLADRPLTDDLVNSAAQGQVDFNGLLADNIRGAGSPQERDAAVRALRAYQSYLQADQALAAKVMASPKAAVVPAPQLHAIESAFDQLDWEFSVSIQDLQSQLEASMTRAQWVLASTAILEALTLFIAALAFWGVQPRIQEYRAGAQRLRTA
jgi:hypothetical protein